MDNIETYLEEITLIRKATRSVKVKETGLCMSRDQIESIRRTVPIAENLKKTGLFPDSLRNFDSKLEIIRKYGIKI